MTPIIIKVLIAGGIGFITVLFTMINVDATNIETLQKAVLGYSFAFGFFVTLALLRD